LGVGGVANKESSSFSFHVATPSGVLLTRGLIVQKDDTGDYYVSLGFHGWCAIAILMKKVVVGDQDPNCLTQQCS